MGGLDDVGLDDFHRPHVSVSQDGHRCRFRISLLVTGRRDRQRDGVKIETKRTSDDDNGGWPLCLSLRVVVPSDPSHETSSDRGYYVLSRTF